ncbi:unnamed protein product [Miscanthus lutarioriparius]|uniref:DUF4220 domain-containing protein n=1 Tax=Miscanthus lutarioriparius TaxID=422564 RepID=A0A811NAV8_9POAL|nr:unnamed protein product [Miscanthus lutarioriparius]
MLAADCIALKAKDHHDLRDVNTLLSGTARATVIRIELANGSWNLNKMVADYMYEEHSRSGPSYDPTSMKGYHYLVDWPLDESKLEARMSYAMELTVDGAQIIDIERIWLCNELSSELKDVCLSFSLFHLLRRRFFGFVCAESSQRKTHDFVFKGLLSKNEDGTLNYNRIFRVIEVELTFMYDFFFTKYAVLYNGSKKASTIWSLASASLMSVTIYQLTASVLSIIRMGLNSRIRQRLTLLSQY